MPHRRIDRRAFFATMAAAGLLTPRASTAADRKPNYAAALGFLDYSMRWDSAEIDHADELAARLFKQAPDYVSFNRLAPAGSAERKGVDLYLSQFDAAGRDIRAGRLAPSLFFDGWLSPSATWAKAGPWVIGMRREQGQPGLHADYEWLAGQDRAFWDERARHPLIWPVIDLRPPSPTERQVFQAFVKMWSQPRDAVARTWIAALPGRVKTVDDLRAAAPRGSGEWTKFDRIWCAYDQAGLLMKNGFLNPSLFFGEWPPPSEFWGAAGPWFKAMRLQDNAPHLYDNVDGLVEAEMAWRKLGGRARA